MWPLRMFTRITLYKCIWNRRLLAGSLCNSRTEESQAINKKIRSRRSALPKQRNDLLCGSFPVANYRSTKGYSKYRNYLWYSSETGVVLLFRQKNKLVWCSSHSDIFVYQVISYKCHYCYYYYYLLAEMYVCMSIYLTGDMPQRFRDSCFLILFQFSW